MLELLFNGLVECLETYPMVMNVKEGDYISIEISSNYESSTHGCSLIIYEL